MSLQTPLFDLPAARTIDPPARRRPSPRCRRCNAPLTYPGYGRPRSLCDRCYPETYPERSEVPSPVSGLARTADPATARAVAKADRSKLRAAILDAYRAFGAMNPDECVKALNLAERAPSIRTAIPQLGHAGLLVKTDEKRPSALGQPSTVWRIA